MNEARAEQLGIEPIAGMLAAIDGIESKSDLVRSLAELDRVGVSGVLACYATTDARQSDQYILHLSQAGLGLPDRDYYWDAKFKTQFAAYAEHVERMLALANVPDPKQAAADIVAFETGLAKAQWSRLENRDSIKTYNKKTRDELAELAPEVDWNVYFAALGAEDAREFIVSQPSYLTAVAAMVDSAPLATWKAWLKWQVIREYASLLNKEMADADFAFYGTTLRGIPENRPRWKRAVGSVEGALGEAVGKLYVERHFPPEAKAANGPDGRQSDRGLPPSVRDQRLDEPRDPAEGAGQARDLHPEDRLSEEVAGLFDVGDPPRRPGGQRAACRRPSSSERMLDKLGKPVDRDEWHMTPQTVNAYYNPRHERDRVPGRDPRSRRSSISPRTTR